MIFPHAMGIRSSKQGKDGIFLDIVLCRYW